jgi:hypothetical protein
MALAASRGFEAPPLPCDSPCRKGVAEGAHLCPLSSLSTGGIRLVRLGFRDSFGSWQRRSAGNGSKAFPATARVNGPPCPTRPGGSGAKAGRLTKPPPGGSSGLARRGGESGRLREAPNRDRMPSGGRNRAGRTPDLRVQDQPDGKRDFGSRAVTGMEEASAFEISGRTGFRPGSCETAGTRGFGSWTCQAEPRLRPRIPRQPHQGFGGGVATAGTEGASPRSAERRTAKASALTGSQRGTPKEPGLPKDSGEPGHGPRFGHGFETALADCLASQAWCPSAKGTVGAGGNAGPHYCVAHRSNGP